MPSCPKCGAKLVAVYPLDLKTRVDFFEYLKCKIAYEPKTLKPIAQTV